MLQHTVIFDQLSLYVHFPALDDGFLVVTLRSICQMGMLKYERRC